MINANQMKAGTVIKVENELFLVVSYQHVKPGKGPAYMRTKLKHLTDESVVERTFRSEEKLELVFLEHKKLVFLYSDEHLCFFMDADSYEQVSMEKEKVKDCIELMKDGQEITATLCEEQVISVELPSFISLKVVSTEGGVRGDTVRAVNKNAILETGAQVAVPLFIEAGDIIKVDTRTSKYIGRA